MKAVLGNKFSDVNAVESAEFKNSKAQIPIEEHIQVVVLISSEHTGLLVACRSMKGHCK